MSGPTLRRDRNSLALEFEYGILAWRLFSSSG
jgi:hypothetical protein